MSSSITISSLLGDISQYNTNPAALSKLMMRSLSLIRGGDIEVVDASNAFVFCLEASVVNTAAFIEANQALNRKQYPVASTTYDDLYLHMSDTDFVNMFAIPTTARFNLMFQKSQLINALVLDYTTGISQVVIPRNSVFYASGIPFSIQYPISIRQLQHGGLQAVYLADKPSPLQTLTTNVLDLEEITDPSGVEYVRFSFDTQQFNVVSYINDVNSTGGFKSVVPFTEQFYYCRVYMQDVSGQWIEINTTYTEQVYDPAVPTAVLQVNGQNLICTIPVVYITTNTIRGKIRIDVYQTKGVLSLFMGNYKLTDFSATWLYIDTNDATSEVAAVSKLNNLAIWSTDTTIGGRNSLNFTDTKSRIILNSIGPRQIPITPAQIQAMLTDDGYVVVKNIDSITERAYWATKDLPSPTQANLNTNNMYTSASATILSLVSTIEQDAAAHGVNTHSTGLTITSSALLQTTNGKTGLVSNTQYNQLSSLSLTELAKALNTGAYSFTPFYYVLDTTTEVFYVRPYFLDKPKISSRSFIQENATTGLQVSIDANYAISKTSTGYRLTISTKSNAAYQDLQDSQVFCQLMFVSDKQVSPAYMLGTQQVRANDQGEQTFVFDISTNYDIDSDNFMSMTSFAVAGTTVIPRCSLKQSFKVIFGTTESMPSTFSQSAIDADLGWFQLSSGAKGITLEELELEFGSALPTLWNSYRSYAAEINYQTYPADVPAVYDKDIYAHNPTTGSIFAVNGAGDLVYTKLHSVGEIVKDSSNHTVYAHRAGDPVLDPVTQLPVPLTNYETKLKRSIDVFAIDAVYSFANDPITTSYMDYVKNALLSWLTNDLVSLNTKALEKTNIYFYPKITKGYVNVLINNNLQQSVEAAQVLTVDIYVTKDKYLNGALLASLQATTIQTLGSYLSNNSTVSTAGGQDAVMAAYGNDVTSVNISGLVGYAGNVVVTVLDSSSRLSLAKELVVQANNQMAVKENMIINFIVHDSQTF